MSDATEKKPCVCGRSPTGFCIGFHNMTNEAFQKYLTEKQKALNEQAKPQLLKEG